ncbi:MAG: extracellular solute-binding protein [Chloroflexi bacterium]|nr:extracellular solute-binding protein [Chloroflexota bacterium]
MTGRMIGSVILIGLLCFGAVFLSCAPGQSPEPAVKAPAVPGAGAAPQVGWQQDWEKTLAAAKQEGGLTIYISGAAGTREAIGKAFNEKFGLDIEWVAAPSAALTSKILQERRAGIFGADVTIGSTINQLAVLKPDGHIVPIKPLLVLPEVLDKNLWFRGGIPWVDNEKMYVMNSILTPKHYVTVNSTMVKPEEIGSYNDLLNPKWKGKIVIMNPASSVAPYSHIGAVAGGWDFWRRFTANAPVIVDVDRQVAEWIAQGKYPLGIVARSDVLEEFVKAGAPVARAMPKEGGFLGGGAISASLLERAPHPNAARIFVNWYLSKDGSHVQSKAVAGQSARTDVPTDHLKPENIRDPSAKYIEVENEQFFLMLSQDRERDGPAMQIFGPLMGRK